MKISRGEIIGSKRKRGQRFAGPRTDPMQCTECGQVKPLMAFLKCRTSSRRCKTCWAHSSRIKRAFLKSALIAHYSNGTNACACCGEGHLVFLAIDHIAGGGNKHFKELENGDAQSGGSRFYDWLRKNECPVGYRVLCFNCNWAIGQNGTCPHQSAKDLGEVRVHS